jgi:hypothetical protein
MCANCFQVFFMSFTFLNNSLRGELDTEKRLQKSAHDPTNSYGSRLSYDIVTSEDFHFP